MRNLSGTDIVVLPSWRGSFESSLESSSRITYNHYNVPGCADLIIDDF